jgi:hypothetical protein
VEGGFAAFTTPKPRFTVQFHDKMERDGIL